MRRFALLIIAVFALLSCRTVKTRELVQYKDSTIHYYKYDTLYITITDTLHIESQGQSEQQSETEITFADGGSYNHQTGEATNVLSVRTTQQIRDLQNLVVSGRLMVEQQAAQIDSLRQETETLWRENSTLKEQQELTWWQRTMIRSGYVAWAMWFVAFIALIVWIALKIRGRC